MNSSVLAHWVEGKDQKKNCTVLEERDRLARELHDCLAQVLGYLILKASITDELVYFSWSK